MRKEKLTVKRPPYFRKPRRAGALSAAMINKLNPVKPGKEPDALLLPVHFDSVGDAPGWIIDGVGRYLLEEIKHDEEGRAVTNDFSRRESYRFIVKAANLHAKLVDAVGAAEYWLRTEAELPPAKRGMVKPDAILRDLRDALRAAGAELA